MCDKISLNFFSDYYKDQGGILNGLEGNFKSS